MFKRVSIILISIFLLVTLLGCDYTEKENGAPDNSIVIDKLISESFSSAPFSDIAEGAPSLSGEDMDAVIAKIPSDKYEGYPETHNAPASATLYKDGRVSSVDIDDERLIRLINFFNNCVYYSKCSYTQGLLPIDYIEEYVTYNNFRLELKYSPYGEEAPSPYGSRTTMCDTIVVTNDFTLIAHDLPGYGGQSERYPFRAVGYFPLYGEYPWLELFGF